MIKLLFVCTGNTCRSPMAQAVFNYKAEKYNLDASADSAGLFADGAPMSANAVKALEDAKIPLIPHKSRSITLELAKEYDYIIGISKNHAAKLIAAYPSAAGRIYAFPTDISDPFGGNLSVYKNTLKEIDSGIDLVIGELFGKSE